MTQPTALERKHAAQQALSMVTAAMEDSAPEGGWSEDTTSIVVDLLRDVDNIALVVCSLIGLSTGLLRSFEDLDRGSSGRWLKNIGLSLESMTGDET